VLATAFAGAALRAGFVAGAFFAAFGATPAAPVFFAVVFAAVVFFATARGAFVAFDGAARAFLTTGFLVAAATAFFTPRALPGDDAGVSRAPDAFLMLAIGGQYTTRRARATPASPARPRAAGPAADALDS
jgi:hypothetical protein